MRRIVTFFVPFLLLLPAQVFAATSDLTITPVIISEEAKARDILKETLTLTNTSERKLTLYPTVHDVSAKEGDQGFDLAEGSGERSGSLANWIELSRGVIELGPGEEKIIPFVIRVNLAATAGMYHSDILFSEGSTRAEAEAKESLGTVKVDVEVKPDIKEVLQLNKFFTDSIFLSGDDVLFNYQVENIGNQNLKPSGEIRIYDRAGKEVASIPVNTDGATFSPEQKAQLASVWNGAQGFGKYKAFLTLNYGDTQRASVQDTVFFWIVPWKELSLVFIIGAMLVMFLVFYYQRKGEEPQLAYAPVTAGDPPPAPVVSEKPRHPRRNWAFWKRRSARKVPRVTVIEDVMEEPEPEPEPTPVRHMMTDVRPQVPVREVRDVRQPVARVSESHSINLKELCKLPNECPPEPPAHHIINLKR